MPTQPAASYNVRSLPLFAILAVACSASADGHPLFREGGDVAAPVPPVGSTPNGAQPSTPTLPVASDGLVPDGSATPTDTTQAPGACASARAETEVISSPVDIIVLMDNSGSMRDEASSVESNINTNFADILDESGVDYRVILISEHRDRDGLLGNTQVCVKSPLSGVTQCPAPEPIATDRFFQYSTEVNSRDSLQIVLETYDGSRRDDFDLAPNGWSEWLRPGAKKVFLEITDDNANLSATEFVSSLSQLAPAEFGSASAPNFVWHSIIGIAEKPLSAEAYLPLDPIDVSECSGNGNDVSNAGETYQELSRQTGGLRFPICQFQAYDTVFQTIANSVVSVTAAACGFALPTPPNGRALELDKVAVSFTPGAGLPTLLGQVKSRDLCQLNAFFIDGNGIELCPEACAAVRADAAASLDVLFTCDSTLILR